MRSRLLEAVEGDGWAVTMTGWDVGEEATPARSPSSCWRRRDRAGVSRDTSTPKWHRPSAKRGDGPRPSAQADLPPGLGRAAGRVEDLGDEQVVLQRRGARRPDLAPDDGGEVAQGI